MINNKVSHKNLISKINNLME